MLNVLYTILEVAYVALPLFVAAIFLLRSSETYADKYSSSKFKGMGISLAAYKIFYRSLGLFCAALACFAVYKNYIAEPEDEMEDARKFWEDVKKTQTSPLQGAMLLGAAVAIPARMGSTRFPGKPLALLGGKAVLERVYENCKKSSRAEKVAILTDSIEILEFADKIRTTGGRAIFRSGFPNATIGGTSESTDIRKSRLRATPRCRHPSSRSARCSNSSGLWRRAGSSTSSRRSTAPWA